MKWDWSNANWKDEAAKGVECNNKKTRLTARSKAIVKVWPILSKKTQHLGQLDLLPHLWKASSCQSHGTVKRVVRNKRRSGQARQDRTGSSRFRVKTSLLEPTVDSTMSI